MEIVENADQRSAESWQHYTKTYVPALLPLAYVHSYNDIYRIKNAKPKKKLGDRVKEWINQYIPPLVPQPQPVPVKIKR